MRRIDDAHRALADAIDDTVAADVRWQSAGDGPGASVTVRLVAHDERGDVVAAAAVERGVDQHLAARSRSGVVRRACSESFRLRATPCSPSVHSSRTSPSAQRPLGDVDVDRRARRGRSSARCASDAARSLPASASDPARESWPPTNRPRVTCWSRPVRQHVQAAVADRSDRRLRAVHEQHRRSSSPCRRSRRCSRRRGTPGGSRGRSRSADGCRRTTATRRSRTAT